MAEEKTQENREDIIRVTGELKLINQKLDNHMSHISQKILYHLGTNSILNLINVFGYRIGNQDIA